MSGFIILVTLIAFSSCEDNTLPEIGSVPDLTPPEASFSATQGIGTNDEWKTYSFTNQSSGATNYAWDFGDGNSSGDFEPFNTFPGEGTFTVTLTASDQLGVESTFSLVIEVVEPIAVVIPDPTLVNSEFAKLPKSSGSDCACSAWINKSIGDQGESSSGNGGSDNVVKFDNNEPDHVYQEFEITPNADYTMNVVVSFKSLTSGGSFPSMFEIRVLAGSGYDSGYTPTYYTNTVDFPQDNYGYTSIGAVETSANNILTEVISNPSDTGYITYTYTFNSGNNTSLALFMRGIGGPASGGGGGSFGYNSGDEEIRVDNVTITAN
ncbi:MAG: PKD domain-containing protein [Flavobacteriaceae bacterium]